MKKLLPALVAAQSLLTVVVAGGAAWVSTKAVAQAAAPAAVEKKKAAGPAAAGHEAKPEAESGPEDVLKALQAGNERFVADHPQAHHFDRERAGLTRSQHPKAMVLSCSDSRLPPELVFDQSLGDLFVVRSAGNVADKIGLASLEYAAEHLHARVLVVLGHEKCGAVTAAAKGGAMPTENLQALVDEIGPSLTTLRGSFQGDELVHRGVEANVEATADEVLDRSPLLKKLVAEGELEVVQAVYDLETGKVRTLAGPQRALSHARAAAH